MSRFEKLCLLNARIARHLRSGISGLAAGAVLSLCAAIATPAAAQISSAERAVLVSIYNNTAGASWTNTTAANAAWTVAASPGGECAWFGVVCAASGASNTVVEVNLQTNNLVGTLPSTLNTLTSLQFLRLQSNTLSGNFPALSGLSALSYVDLRNNQFSGNLPALTGLTALEAFSFDNNQFAGAIPSLAGLSALKVFQGSNNVLTGSIPALTGLTLLEWFHVDGNQLTGTMPSLAGLTALQSFYASNNKLTGALPALTGLSALRFFRADANQLSGNLPSLAGLNALAVFYVRNNQIGGNVVAVPSPTNALSAGLSALCPNQLITSVDTAWDAATGSTPWSTGCVATQAITFGTAPLLLVGGSGTVTASSTPTPGSSATIVFSSLTPLVCTVNSSTGLVTVVGTVGNVCRIAADKAGDTSYSAAPQVVLDITLVVPVNGVCGAANGVASLVAPGTSLCADSSTPTVAISATQFSWTCAGQNTGSSASCTAPRQYTVAVSAGANGTLNCTSPVTSGNTSTCTATPNSGYRTLSISGCGGNATAAGVNSYTTAGITADDCVVSATFEAVIAGGCGPANAVATLIAPSGSTNLCGVGTPSAVTPGSAAFTWSCSGAGGAADSSCSAPRQYTVTASAGPNGTLTCANPVTSGNTSTCTATPNAGYRTLSISGCSGAATAAGVNSYTTAAVTAACTVSASFELFSNGACGAANNVASLVAPSAPTDLCAAGTPIAVTSGSAAFTWSCTGAGGGSTSSCSAPRQYTVTASAGANGTLTCTNPVTSGNTSTCTATPNAGYRTLSIGGCSGSTTPAGVNSYTTAAVTANCTVSASFEPSTDGTCGIANGMASLVAPSTPTNLCSVGAPSAVTSGSSAFTWSCSSVNGGASSSCSAPRQYTVTVTLGAGNHNATVSPSGPQTVTSGSTASLTVTTGNGQAISAVGGSCGGTLNGNTFITAPITGNCTVLFAFDAQSIPTTPPALLGLLAMLLFGLALIVDRRRTHD